VPHLTKVVDTPVLLIDADCALCNGAVKLIFRFEKNPVIRVGSLRSPVSQQLLKDVSFDNALIDSVVLLEPSRVSVKSEAVFRVLKLMGGVARLGLIFSLLPRRWTDTAYDFIARHRKYLFGTSDYCGINTPIDPSRFVD